MMDEEDVALWGIGGILICLFFTCYAIITKDLRRRTVALLTGTPNASTAPAPSVPSIHVCELESLPTA
jgi:hypothetical protein